MSQTPTISSQLQTQNIPVDSQSGLPSGLLERGSLRQVPRSAFSGRPTRSELKIQSGVDLEPVKFSELRTRTPGIGAKALDKQSDRARLEESITTKFNRREVFADETSLARQIAKGLPTPDDVVTNLQSRGKEVWSEKSGDRRDRTQARMRNQALRRALGGDSFQTALRRDSFWNNFVSVIGKMGRVIFGTRKEDEKLISDSARRDLIDSLREKPGFKGPENEKYLRQVEAWLDDENRNFDTAKQRIDQKIEQAGNSVKSGLLVPMKLQQDPGHWWITKVVLWMFTSATWGELSGTEAITDLRKLADKSDDFQNAVKEWMKGYARSDSGDPNAILFALRYGESAQVKEDIKTQMKLAMEQREGNWRDLFRGSEDADIDKLVNAIYNGALDALHEESIRNMIGRINTAYRTGGKEKYQEAAFREIQQLRDHAWEIADHFYAIDPDSFKAGMVAVENHLRALEENMNEKGVFEIADVGAKVRGKIKTEIRALRDELPKIEAAYTQAVRLHGYDGKDSRAGSLQRFEEHVGKILEERPNLSVPEREKRFQRVEQELTNLGERLIENRSKLSPTQFKYLQQAIDNARTGLRKDQDYCRKLDTLQQKIEQSTSSRDLPVSEWRKEVFQLVEASIADHTRLRAFHSDGILHPIQESIKSDSAKFLAAAGRLESAFKATEMVDEMLGDIAKPQGVRATLLRTGKGAEEFLGKLGTLIRDFPEFFDDILQKYPDKFPDYKDGTDGIRRKAIRDLIDLPREDPATPDRLDTALDRLEQRGLITDGVLHGLASWVQGNSGSVGGLADLLEKLGSKDLGQVQQAAKELFPEADTRLQVLYKFVDPSSWDDMLRNHYADLTKEALAEVCTSHPIRKAFGIIGVSPSDIDTPEKLLKQLPALIDKFPGYFEDHETLALLEDRISDLENLIDPDLRNLVGADPSTLNEMVQVAQVLAKFAPNPQQLQQARQLRDQEVARGILGKIDEQVGVSVDSSDHDLEMRNGLANILSGSTLPLAASKAMERELGRVQNKVRDMRVLDIQLERTLLGKASNGKTHLENLGLGFPETPGSIEEALRMFESQNRNQLDKVESILDLARLGSEDIAESLKQQQKDQASQYFGGLRSVNPETMERSFTTWWKNLATGQDELVSNLRKSSSDKADSFAEAWQHLQSLYTVRRAKGEMQDYLLEALEVRDSYMKKTQTTVLDNVVRAAVLQTFQETRSSASNFTFDRSDPESTNVARAREIAKGWGLAPEQFNVALLRVIPPDTAFDEVLDGWKTSVGTSEEFALRSEKLDDALNGLEGILTGLQSVESDSIGGLVPSGPVTPFPPLREPTLTTVLPQVTDRKATWAKPLDQQPEKAASLFGPLKSSAVQLRAYIQEMPAGTRQERAAKKAMREVLNEVVAAYVEVERLSRLKAMAPGLKINAWKVREQVGNLTKGDAFSPSSRSKLEDVKISRRNNEIESLRSRLSSDLSSIEHYLNEELDRIEKS